MARTQTSIFPCLNGPVNMAEIIIIAAAIVAPTPPSANTPALDRNKAFKIDALRVPVNNDKSRDGRS